MTTELRRWREAGSLTQVEAARLLGVSQTYLSLLEKGTRPLTSTLWDRLDAVRSARGGAAPKATLDNEFRAQLSALGYPGFSHFDPVRPAVRPTVVLLNALAEPTIDARVAEALPWLVREYCDRINWRWLVEQAKLRNLQNRLGFLVQVASGGGRPALSEVLQDLEKARLMAEATFCQDAMPDATRELVRARRSPEAAHWNVVSLLRGVGAE